MSRSAGPRRRAGRAAATQEVRSEEIARIDRFVHDLNSPLSALSMQLYLRRRSLRAPTSQDLHFLEVLDRNVERIRKTVEDLRAGATRTPATPSGGERAAHPG